MTKIDSKSEEIKANPESAAPRQIYNGQRRVPSSDVQPRSNLPVKSRKRSPLNIIGILLVVSMMIVFYIWNKISVNRLAVEVNDLQNHYEKIINANEFVHAEIIKKSSLERIEKRIASERMGLISPREQPVWFELDNARLERLAQQ